jgi:hypothetical protein
MDDSDPAVWRHLGHVAHDCGKMALALYAYEHGLRKCNWDSNSTTCKEQLAQLGPIGWECLLGLCEVSLIG